MDITKKGKLGQFFCKHKNNGWYKKNSTFSIISGEQSYKVCRDCGKILDEQFIRYD